MRRDLHPWRPLLKGLKNCFCIKNIFKPFSRGLQGWRAHHTLWNTEFLDPRKGLKGHLCPGIKLLGIIYIVDTPFVTPNQRCSTFQNSREHFHAPHKQLHACTWNCAIFVLFLVFLTFLMLFCHVIYLEWESTYVGAFSQNGDQESVNLFTLSMAFLSPKHQNHWFCTELFFRLCKLDAACGAVVVVSK